MIKNKFPIKSNPIFLLFVLILGLSVIPCLFQLGYNPIANNIAWIFVISVIWLGSRFLKNELLLTKFSLNFIFSFLLIITPLFLEPSTFEGSFKIIIFLFAILYLITLHQFEFTLKQSNNLLRASMLPGLIFAIFSLTSKDVDGNVISYFITLGIAGWLLVKTNELKFISLITPVILIPAIALYQSYLLIILAFISLMLIVPFLYLNSRPKLKLWFISITTAVIATVIVFLIKHIDLNMHFSNILSKHNLLILKQDLNLALTVPYSGYGYGYYNVIYTKILAYWNFANAGNNIVLENAKPKNILMIFFFEGGFFALASILYLTYQIVQLFKSHSLILTLTRITVGIPIILAIYISDFLINYPFIIFTFINIIFYLDLQQPSFNLTPPKIFKSIYKNFINIVSFIVIMLLLLNIYIINNLNNYNQLYKKLTNLDIFKDNYEKILKNQQFLNNISNADINQTAILLNYISWAEDYIKTEPSPDLYLKLMLAYKKLGQLPKVKYYQKEGSYLYPNNQNFLKLSPAPITESSIEDNQFLKILPPLGPIPAPTIQSQPEFIVPKSLLNPEVTKEITSKPKTAPKPKASKPKTKTTSKQKTKTTSKQKTNAKSKPQKKTEKAKPKN